jgi:hypothetical protein
MVAKPGHRIKITKIAKMAMGEGSEAVSPAKSVRRAFEGVFD